MNAVIQNKIESMREVKLALVEEVVGYPFVLSVTRDINKIVMINAKDILKATINANNKLLEMKLENVRKRFDFNQMSLPSFLYYKDLAEKVFYEEAYKKKPCVKKLRLYRKRFMLICLKYFHLNQTMSNAEDKTINEAGVDIEIINMNQCFICVLLYVNKLNFKQAHEYFREYLKKDEEEIVSDFQKFLSD